MVAKIKLSSFKIMDNVLLNFHTDDVENLNGRELRKSSFDSAWKNLYNFIYYKRKTLVFWIKFGSAVSNIRVETFFW